MVLWVSVFICLEVNIDNLNQYDKLKKYYKDILLKQSKVFSKRFLYEVEFYYFGMYMHNLDNSGCYVGSAIKVDQIYNFPLESKGDYGVVENLIKEMAFSNAIKVDEKHSGEQFYLYALRIFSDQTKVPIDGSRRSELMKDEKLNKEHCELVCSINYISSSSKHELFLRQKSGEFLYQYASSPLDLKFSIDKVEGSTLVVSFSYDGHVDGNRDVFINLVHNKFV